MNLTEILGYWEALPEKVRILIICFLGVTSVVWMLRNGFLFDIQPKTLRRKLIYATALLVGALGGISGFFLTDTQPDWFWAFVASTGGGASVAIHHITIKIIWPKLMKKAGNSRVVSKDQVLKMPKPEGKPDAPTEFYIKDD